MLVTRVLIQESVNLFAQMADEGTTYRTEVSYLEICTEKAL